MNERSAHIDDVFVSHSHRDRAWVRRWLLPRPERVGLQVCIDYRDFDVGVPGLVNMERAVENSRHTLLVLTPALGELEEPPWSSAWAGTACACTPW